MEAEKARGWKNLFKKNKKRDEILPAFLSISLSSFPHPSLLGEDRQRQRAKTESKERPEQWVRVSEMREALLYESKQGTHGKSN